MRGLLDFLWLLIRCVAFLWVIVTVIILGLFAVGTEGDGYSWAERCVIAVQYAGYVAGIFGGLLAIHIWWQAWRIERKNRKKAARQEKTRTGEGVPNRFGNQDVAQTETTRST